jgi:hypothetical protein
MQILWKIVFAFMLVSLVTVVCPMEVRGDPSELPEVSVEPSTTTVWEGQTFSLNLTISDLNASFKMGAFIVGADYVTEFWLIGAEWPFLKQFPTPPYTSENCTDGALFLELTSWQIGMFLLPVFDPAISNPVFPEGNGTLLTLIFKADAPGITTIVFGGKLIGNTSPPTELDYEATATVEVKPNGDLNGDSRVDLKDIGMVGKAFGSRPSDANWLIQADMNKDSKIDLMDIALIARNFGKSFS